MTEFWESLREYVTVEQVVGIVRGVLILAVGFILARLLARGAERLLEDRADVGQTVLVRRLVFYGVIALFAVAALHELGFKLSVLLGAAGVLSVAVGFASQTSASNLVSGLFLITERAFSIGDVIQVGSTTGEVLSIDLLSAKLRTFDNVYVRIPNETLIKSEVRTLTKFPIRRVDLQIGIAYKEDLERVHQILLEVGERNPLCLAEPTPTFIVVGFGDSSVDIQFSPWALKKNYVELKNSIQREIKLAFDEAGVEIPFPHRVLLTSDPTEIIAPGRPASTPPETGSA